GAARECLYRATCGCRGRKSQVSLLRSYSRLRRLKPPRRVSESTASSALPPPSITQDCGGTPIIMQGLECPKTPAADGDHAKQRPHGPFPRGSGAAYQPLVPPSPTLLRPPAVAPYQPPPINSFSDRATQCVHSFTFNAGLGNNPLNRDAYIRSCVNN